MQQQYKATQYKIMEGSNMTFKPVFSGNTTQEMMNGFQTNKIQNKKQQVQNKKQPVQNKKQPVQNKKQQVQNKKQQVQNKTSVMSGFSSAPPRVGRR